MDLFAPFVHWSFFAVAVVLTVAGDFIKRLVIPGATLSKPTRQIGDGPYMTNEPTTEATPTTISKWPWWRRWYYRTIPIHPVIAGGLLGLLMEGFAPEVVADKPLARVLYYAVSGAFCTWIYSAASQWVKRLGGATVSGA